jgi:hypothetical protein
VVRQSCRQHRDRATISEEEGHHDGPGQRHGSVGGTVPVEVGGDYTSVWGDFNDWSQTATPMGKRDGSFVATVILDSGTTYRFG